MWGPSKKKKDPHFPGNGGPNDPRLPYLVGTLLWHRGISLHCVTKWGVTPGLFGDHFVVSNGRCVCLWMCLWSYFSLHTGRFHVACLFWAFHPPPPFFIVIHYLPSRSSRGLSVQFDRGWGRVFLVSGACGWVSSRVGSWVF